MNLAIINLETNIVENIIVPPKGAQAYFVPDGYIAVKSDIASIGDTYSPETQEFIKPSNQAV